MTDYDVLVEQLNQPKPRFDCGGPCGRYAKEADQERAEAAQAITDLRALAHDWEVTATVNNDLLIKEEARADALEKERDAIQEQLSDCVGTLNKELQVIVASRIDASNAAYEDAASIAGEFAQGPGYETARDIEDAIRARIKP